MPFKPAARETAMVHSTLYDDDILAWSEQQAEALRTLARTRRDLPNELDLENIAEEIEDVGRSQLYAVQSRIRLILLHLIKLAAQPHSDAVRHWRSEIILWQDELAQRFTPSMRQRVDLDRLWRKAFDLACEIMPALEPHRADIGPCPLGIDELLLDELPLDDLISRVRAAFGPAPM